MTAASAETGSTGASLVGTVHALKGGSESGFNQRVEAFFRTWTRFLGGRIRHELSDPGHWWSEARYSSEGIMLKGMRHFPLIISSHSSPRKDRLLNYTGRLAVYICSEESSQLEIKHLAGSDLWVVLTIEMTSSILSGATLEEARQRLIEQVRAQVPRRALIPFQTTKAVDGAMFEGRKEELDRLLYDHETSFALIGASRIGKTSLAKQYMNLLAEKEDGRHKRLFSINFQNLALKTDDAVAQEIAKTLFSSTANERMQSHKLRDFIQNQAASKGGPLQLILDECDEICDTWMFNQLCEWSRLADSPCRIIALGKSHLVRKVLHSGESAVSRLEYIRPRPLLEEEAWKLFRDPIRQLGIEIEDVGSVRKEVWKRTMGLPNQVQHVGKRLAFHACKTEPPRITLASFNSAYEGFLNMSLLRGHLHDMTDLLGQIAALIVLLRDGEYTVGIWSARRLSNELTQYGITVDVEETIPLLDELVLHYFLIWDRGTYTAGRWDFRHIADMHRSDIGAMLQDKLSTYKKSEL